MFSALDFNHLRIFMLYQPAVLHDAGVCSVYIGVCSGAALAVVLFFSSTQKPMYQGLILAAILILIGFQLWMFGLLADLMAANRRINGGTATALRQDGWIPQKKVQF